MTTPFPQQVCNQKAVHCAHVINDTINKIRSEQIAPALEHVRTTCCRQSDKTTLYKQAKTIWQDLRASTAFRNLQDAIGTSPANALLILTAAPRVERQAVCGNEMCEAGERSTGNGSALGIPLAFEQKCIYQVNGKCVQYTIFAREDVLLTQYFYCSIDWASTGWKAHL